MTIEQLMSKKGYSQQEITDLKPLLSNVKFRKDLEDELTAFEGNATKMQADLDEYDRWFTQDITKEHGELLQRVADAEANAAAATARAEAYKKTGMRVQAGQLTPEQAAAAAEEEVKKAKEAAKGAGVDPRYVTADTFQQSYEKVGEAIAVASNIVSSHMQLFPGEYLDMEQLRTEAKAAKKPVKEFWETKYKVADKRTEIANKRTADAEARVRADERQKVMAEFGGGSNPNIVLPSASKNAFVERKKADAGKQPWERNENELSKARIEKAISNASKRGDLVTA